jgi:enamine deaminase RidA (YjgF/YER057c/UK114 family)
MSEHRVPVEVERTSFFMPYAPVIRVRPGGDLLFVSGATALPLYHEHPHRHEELDPPEDVREQTRLVMENLTRCLAAAGATWKDVVRTDLFVTDMADQDAIGEVMGPYFDGDFPASTLVEVKRLVDARLKLEMSAIAVVPSAGAAPSG